jgi:hypothetical protein
MIYLKSVLVGLAFTVGALYATVLLGGLVLGVRAHLGGQREAAFWISLRSPYLWLPCMLVFIAGFFWAYRRFSK